MLRAMGAPLLILGASCTAPQSENVAPRAPVIPTTAVIPTTHVIPTPPATHYDLAPLTSPQPPSGQCPSVVCQQQGRLPPSSPAPAPFEVCEVTFAYDDATDGLGFRPNPSHEPQQFDARQTAERRNAGASSACCYVTWIACGGRGGGRAYRPSLMPIVARITSRDDWAPVTLVVAGSKSTPLATDHALGNEWAADAALEHASVASFSRLALQLMALQAPAELLARSLRASLDEIEHARSAYSIASALLGHRVGPGELAAPTNIPTDRETLLLETVFDGCIGELAATYEAQALATSSADARIRKHHAKVARDEMRHAELAFNILGWLLADACAHESNAEILAGLAQLLEAELHALERVSITTDEKRRQAGRPDANLQAQARRRAIGEVVLPCIRNVLREGARAAA